MRRRGKFTDIYVWKSEDYIRLAEYIESVPVLFWDRFLEQIKPITTEECQEYTDIVKSSLGCEAFNSLGRQAAVSFIHEDLPKLLKALTEPQNTSGDRGKKWFQYAVASMILLDANLIDARVATFFWRPILMKADKESLENINSKMRIRRDWYPR